MADTEEHEMSRDNVVGIWRVGFAGATGEFFVTRSERDEKDDEQLVNMFMARTANTAQDIGFDFAVHDPADVTVSKVILQ